MSERARMVLAWIDAIEDRAPWLSEHFDDVFASSWLAPGQIVFVTPQLPLPPIYWRDLDVLTPTLESA